jgi:hypothetical protein
MSTLSDIESSGSLTGDVTLQGLVNQLEGSSDPYAVENFICRLIFALNNFENMYPDLINNAKANASWGISGSGIASFSVKGLCNFTGGVPSIGNPA